MSLFTWGNEKEQRDVFAIKIPGLLSFLSYNRFEGQVKGIRELQALYELRYGPGDYSPPVKWTYWTFRIMAGAGLVMLALAGWAVLALGGGTLGGSPLSLRSLGPGLLVPYVGNSAGWIFTEIGRQPWIVFGLQKTEAAVSPNVGPGEVLFTLVAFTLLYGALMAADIFLLVKFARAGIHGTEPVAGALGDVPAHA